MKRTKLVVGLLFAALSAAAMATVTINADGSGFIGKGDVQVPFGWNNATAQQKASGVTFAYVQSNTYAAVCEWITGENSPRGVKVHTVNKSKSTEVVSTLSADPRKTGQYTGWILSGFGAYATTGETPEVGGACLGEGAEGTFTSVELQSTSTQLTATSDGVSKEIVITPVAIAL